MMMLGVCLVIGALIDIFVNTFMLSHLLLIVCGGALIAVNILGNGIPYLKGIGKSLISVACIAITLFMLIGFGSNDELVDKETQDILDQADQLMEDKGYEAAIKLLEDKNNDLGWNKAFTIKMADIYLTEGMQQEATWAYQTVVWNMPEDLEARKLYGAALIDMKDYHTALTEGQYLVKLDPEFADGYVIMGDAYRGLFDHFREIYYYKIAVGLDEKSVPFRVKLAEAYASSHSYDEAEEQYELVKTYAKNLDDEILIYESYLRVAEADEVSSEEVSQ